MRTMMLTLTTVGLLAVPAGVALAQSDDAPEPAGPVATCVEQERGRECDRAGEQMGPGARLQQQMQERTQAQLHDGTCDGESVRTQHRAQEHVGTADGAMQRRGPAPAGNG